VLSDNFPYQDLAQRRKAFMWMKNRGDFDGVPMETACRAKVVALKQKFDQLMKL
jgi:hypothetical protein